LPKPGNKSRGISGDFVRASFTMKGPGMADRIRIIRHAESFEIQFPDGSESVYFYYEDEPTRRGFMGRMMRNKPRPPPRHLQAPSATRSCRRPDQDGIQRRLPARWHH
jgi:hypothetical protein